MNAAITESLLLERARAMLPALAERRRDAAEQRRLPDRSIADMIDAGFFRALQPRRVGGYELPFGVQTSIGAVLGEACGSTAWIASVLATHHWMLGKLDPRAQDDIWSKNPRALVSSAFSSSNVVVRSTADGFTLSGRWHFSSGVTFADWVTVLVPLSNADGSPAEARFMVVPKQDFHILDTWRSPGLRATGTHDLDISHVFVPHYRSIGVVEADQPDTPGTRSGAGEAFRLPFLRLVNYCVAAPTLGMARGALQAFTASMSARVGKQGLVAQNTTLQLRVAESAAEIDCARLLYDSDLALIRGLQANGGHATAAHVVRIERNASYVGVLNRRAIARLSEAMGARGQQEDHFVHQAHLDVQSACAHISMVWDINGLAAGRLLLGLAPR